MADEIKALDLKLVGDLFGSGYVMDFTNQTYAEFFRTDVGIEIYNDAYLVDSGNSKGKRLRVFLQRGQKAAIVKALHGLWEWRVNYLIAQFPGQPDSVPRGLERLNALIVRLGGRPIPREAPTAAPAQAPVSTISTAPPERVLAELEQEFIAMMGMDEAPQKRGYAFERFLKRWFDAWGLDAHASFTTKGEQIDGSFQHDNATYLVEAKWHTRPADAQMLHGFHGKLLERPDWTRGLYVSYGGFSGDSFDAFTARRLIMMDGSDIYYALNRRLDLGVVVGKKARHHVEKRQPFAKVTDLFPA